MSAIRGQQYTAAFKVVDIEDYATPLPTADVTVQISVDGEAFTDTTNDAQTTGSGWFSVLLTNEEMQAAEIVLKATAAGAAQSDRLIVTSIPPVGGGGSKSSSNHGQCMWWDDDFKKAMAFFNGYPNDFKKEMDKLDEIRRGLRDSHTGTDDLRKIIAGDSNANIPQLLKAQHGDIQGDMVNLENKINTVSAQTDCLEWLLVKIASPSLLNDYIEHRQSKMPN